MEIRREVECPSRLCPKCYVDGNEIFLETYDYKSVREYCKNNYISGGLFWGNNKVRAMYERSWGYECPECGFRESSFEQIKRINDGINKLEKEWRYAELLKMNIEPSMTYYCPKCRSNHRAGTVRGFKHLDLRNSVIGDNHKCVVCGKELPSGKRKFCSSECIGRNKYVCRKCGRYWKGDIGVIGCGSVRRRLCGKCDWKVFSDSFSNVVNKLGTQDDYKKLGLNIDATKEEITKRYHELARRYHPDLGGDEEKMIEVNVAYDNIMSISKED